VIDSPHREIANLLTWSMNEHTIEYTPDEAAELVRLAGFDVTSVRGVWLCRDPSTGATLPLDPFAAGVSSDEIVRRVPARRPPSGRLLRLVARGAPDRTLPRRRSPARPARRDLPGRVAGALPPAPVAGG
jgi:hypothetical protein